MQPRWRALLCALSCSVVFSGVAAAQKSGGILRGQLVDNLPSGSLHEESSTSVIVPFMPVYKGLVVYDQLERRNSLDTIRPDLAESWSWNDDRTTLTFKLRDGVKWHDCEPFTAEEIGRESRMERGRQNV